MNRPLTTITIILSLLVFLTAKASNTFTELHTSPKREIRAVWLTTYGGLDWPKTRVKDDWTRKQQKEELIRMLDGLQAANINTVLFQARTRGLVAYPSRYESFDMVWTGKEGHYPGYDPMQFVVDECHKRGMECHAWVVCISQAKIYRSPNNESTADYLASICEEITRRYDIDGISLDYIRYGDGKPKGVSAWQARENITRIVRRIHDKVKAAKPWVKMSCSPIGKYKETRNLWSKYNAYERGQDVERWTREGLMDIIFPMSYWDGKDFYPWIPQWKQIENGRIIAPGIGTYFLDYREGRRTLAEQIAQHNYVRHDAGMGFALFRAQHLLANHKGIYDFIKYFCPHPALAPSIAPNAPKPQQPQDVTVERGETKTTISWTPQENTMVNVYASREWPVDISKAKNIIALRVKGSQIVIPTGYKLHYAVTTIDRYGNESDEISTAKEKFRSALSYRPDNSKSYR
ncbi:MAG: family 10 glycosylhydrolase [Bacteroidaceae bacterium]|nr:family 10 glycosylhydrolase [Bacteroidaceae bacterium]